MELKNKSFLVLGAGGISGTSTTDLLKLFTDQIYVYDQNPNLNFNNFINLSKYNLDDEKDIKKIIDLKLDYCIISPGFPRKSLIVKYLENSNINVIGELDLGYYIIFHYLKEKPFVIAITGTDGKSTTTNLIAHLLRSIKINAIECGNYGLPLTKIAYNKILNLEGIPEVLVIECSSYQLEKIYYFNPDISIFLNIDFDHMDRYESLKEYLFAKLNIISLYNKLIISNSVLQTIEKYNLTEKIKKFPVEIIYPEETQNEYILIENKPLYWKDFPVDNQHNRINLLFSIRAILYYLKFIKKEKELDLDGIFNGIQNYIGLAFRLQKIKQLENIIFVNDSKSTTIQSLLSAINTYKDYYVLLLIGGLDKNLDFTPIKELKIYKENKLEIFPFGKAAEKIKNQLGISIAYNNLEEAFMNIVFRLKEIKNKYKEIVVLLSPACASFDQYKNYKERGEHFNQLVHSITNL